MMLLREVIHTQQQLTLFGPAFSSSEVRSFILQVLRFQLPQNGERIYIKNARGTVPRQWLKVRTETTCGKTNV